jgi:hypothetical protein
MLSHSIISPVRGEAANPLHQRRAGLLVAPCAEEASTRAIHRKLPGEVSCSCYGKFLHCVISRIGWYDNFDCHSLFAKFDRNCNATLFTPCAFRERCSDSHEASQTRPSTRLSCTDYDTGASSFFGRPRAASQDGFPVVESRVWKAPTKMRPQHRPIRLLRRWSHEQANKQQVLA